MGILRLPGLVQTTELPNGPVEIDWTNPITKGLVSLLWVVDGKPRDLVNTGIIFTVSGVTPSVGKRGAQYTLAARGSSGIYGPRGSYGKAQLQLPLTLLWIGEANTSDTSGGSLGGVGDGVNGGFSVRNSFGNRYGVIRLNGVGVGVGNAVLLKAGPNALGLVADGTNLILYEGGIRKESTAASGTVNYDATFGHIGLFGNVPDGVIGAAGSAQYQAVWDRVVPDSEMRSLAANPRQIIRPTPRLMLISAGGSAAALAGTSTTSASSSGTMTTAVTLVGTSQTSSLSLGAVTTAIRLAGTSTISSTSNGALLTGIPLIGSSGTPVFSSGALTTAIKLAGSSASSTISSGSLLSNAAALTGTSSSSVSSSAALSTGILLTGTSRTSSVSLGGINTLPVINVIPAAQSVVFSGGTNRVTFDGGTNRVVFDGGTTRAVFGTNTTRVIFDGGINKVTF